MIIDEIDAFDQHLDGRAVENSTVADDIGAREVCKQFVMDQ